MKSGTLPSGRSRALLLLGLTALWPLSALRPAAPVARAQAGARYSEALVIKGQDLGSLLGAGLDQVQVWLLIDGEWRREVAQLDEKVAGAYVETEDRLLDADDELAFNFAPGGQLASVGQTPPGVAVDAPRAQIAVTDPLAAGGNPQYFYAFAVAGAAAPAVQPPAVAYDATARLFKGSGYALGLADQDQDFFIGVRELRLGGSETDLLDRLKIRLTLSASLLGQELAITEENLNDTLGLLGTDLSADPVKIGPVRSLVGGGGTLYAQRFSLLRSLGDLGDLSGGGGIDFGLKDTRISLDLSPAAEGATYRDANLVSGVKVDGKPDVVPASPLPAWRELSFPMGRLLILTRPGEKAAKASAYYKDDVALDGNDTGDGQSWGDAGVFAPDAESLLASGFPGEMVVLPAGSPVTAAGLAAQYLQPLQVVVTSSGSQPATPTRTALPTGTLPTAVPTAVGATATASPGDVTLKGTVFAGTVGSGQPLSGARISFQPCNPHQPFTALSGSDGSYQLLLPRDYVISCGAQVPIEVSKTGFATAIQSIPLVDLFRQPQRDFALAAVPGGKAYIPFTLKNAPRP
ncbi:MAG: hypothetical protein ACH37Z_10795 [Anaerolineae bacterium]